MSDIGSRLPVPINETTETKAMKMKWLQAAKQERVSKIVHLKQAIEDLLQGKIPEIERQIMYAESELSNLVRAEELLKNSVDTSEVK